jgi:hypothetical protein
MANRSSGNWSSKRAAPGSAVTPVFIGNLHLLDQDIFFFRVHCGGHLADGFNTAAAVRLPYHVGWIKAVGKRPDAPDALHGWSGIHQYAVHVKENRLGGEDHLSE